jgi:hypothetical protein
VTTVYGFRSCCGALSARELRRTRRPQRGPRAVIRAVGLQELRSWTSRSRKVWLGKKLALVDGPARREYKDTEVKVRGCV